MTASEQVFYIYHHFCRIIGIT